MVKHVMADLETWGKGPTAQIISIGAVAFDPFDPEGEMVPFHVAIDPRSWFGIPGVPSPFEIDPGTVMWWMDAKQAEARADWLARTKMDLGSALAGLIDWWEQVATTDGIKPDRDGLRSMPTWGNGATFDNVILSHAFKMCSLIRPWSYKDDRCYRTLRSLCPQFPGPLDSYVQEMVGGLSHTALFDATWQAEHLRSIFVHAGVSDPRPAAEVRRGVDYEKIRATTEEDIQRHMVEDGEVEDKTPADYAPFTAEEVAAHDEAVRDMMGGDEPFKPDPPLGTFEQETSEWDLHMHANRQLQTDFMEGKVDPATKAEFDKAFDSDVTLLPPRENEGELPLEAFHHCPRRGNGPGVQDLWNTRGGGARTCSYCGSLHPDEFMAVASSGGKLGATDKNYKSYVDFPGSPHTKFYFQHLDDAQKTEFVNLLNERRLNYGDYPLYVDPFFVARTVPTKD